MNAILDRDFPALPALRAQWAPVYMEPILKSGERITVGVAAIPASGEPTVISALREDSVKFAFGESGMTLLQSAEICLETLREHLKAARSFAGWSAPFYGVEIGATRVGAGNTLIEIVRMALRMSASFSALEPDADDRMVAQVMGQVMDSEDRWPKQIRAAVQTRSPNLDGNFNRPFRIVQGAGTETKYDYLGPRYAAMFGKVIPTSQRKSSTITNARAKLWALARLRDTATTLTVDTCELILYRPEDNDVAYSEAQIKLLHELLTEIREEGKREEIETYEASLASDAATRIIEREAA